MDIVRQIVPFISMISPVQFCAMFFCLRRKCSVASTFCVYLACNLLLNASNVVPFLNMLYGYVPLLLFFRFIPLVLCCEGRILHKLFLFFAVQCVMLTIRLVTDLMGEITFGFPSDGYWLVYTALFFLLVVLCCVSLLKYGRRVARMLFDIPGRGTWALYVAGVVLCFFVLRGFTGAPWRPETRVMDTIAFLPALLLPGWSFGILIYSIYNTHRHTVASYELRLSRSVLNAGKEYYALLQDKQMELRRLRHDYKHHLNILQNLLRVDQKEQADQYLQALGHQYDDTETIAYSGNLAVDALITGFAAQCREKEIAFDVSIHFPQTVQARNYELCIVLGNLLDNAMEACERLPKTEARYIHIEATLKGKQLAIRVENSFDGILVIEEGELMSRKAAGGLGIRNIRAIANSLGGDYYPQWRDRVFSAYVLLDI